jgi:hypothetical protein
MTRNGKIARLPKAIRDRLNQQILDGVPGKDLVHWLNCMREVQEILLKHFNVGGITEQNLSEWKQGGYQDWLKHQERRDWVRRLSDEAEDVAEDSGLMPWMERVGALFEVVLGKVVEKQLQQTVETPEQMTELITLSRELARHRQLSQEAARWKAELVKKDLSEKSKDMDDHIEHAQYKALMHYLRMMRHQNAIKQFTKGMTPEGAGRFEEMVDAKAMEYLSLLNADPIGFAEPSDDPDPSESDSIRPDLTSSSAPAPSSPPQDLPAAGPQKSVKIDGSPKDRKASAA